MSFRLRLYRVDHVFLQVIGLKATLESEKARADKAESTAGNSSSEVAAVKGELASAREEVGFDPHLG